MPKVNLTVEIPGSAKALAGPDGDKAALELGMAKFSSVTLQQMSKLGVDVEIAGIVHTDRGFAFVTKEAILKCANALSGKIGEDANLEDLSEIATALGKCAKGIGLLSGKNIGGEDKPQAPAAPRISFAPGQQVIFNVQQEKPKP